RTHNMPLVAAGFEFRRDFVDRTPRFSETHKDQPVALGATISLRACLRRDVTFGRNGWNAGHSTVAAIAPPVVRTDQLPAVYPSQRKPRTAVNAHVLERE